MTIPEASQLILQAAAVGQGGEIFVLEMGQPVNITYLAEQMIRLSGRTPGREVSIVYTGLRPGEKLHEALFNADETILPTRHEKLMQAAQLPIQSAALESALRALEAACERHAPTDECLGLLRSLVPDFETPALPQTTPQERPKLHEEMS
jgi:FlaA1/EpsC-like NDP-sugar epimerase